MDSVGRNGTTLNIQRAPFINRKMPTAENGVEVFIFVCCVDTDAIANNAELPIAEVASIGAHVFKVAVHVHCLFAHILDSVLSANNKWKHSISRLEAWFPSGNCLHAESFSDKHFSFHFLFLFSVPYLYISA